MGSMVGASREVAAGRADYYSQPDAPDPVLEPELVLSLARTHLPAGLRVSRVVEVDESGGGRGLTCATAMWW